MFRILIRNKVLFIIVMLIFIVTIPSAFAQRKITPINTPQTATQPINEFQDDTARINAKMRASMKHYVDDRGNLIYVDTVTGKEWHDTLALKVRQPMKYPLLYALSIGVDIWNPLMRAFGQHYGLLDFSAQISLHNRYKPVFETGLGLAHNTPADNNFTYKSPLSVYFRLGADYNFLYNSDPQYQYFIGLRYGFSSFSFSIEDISILSTYWDETAHPSIPAQHPFVGWWEFVMGLKVQLWGPISAGWTLRYHNIIHESKSTYGNPWYIPGFGTRGSSISGSFTITYTLDLNQKTISSVKSTEPSVLIPTPERDDPYAPGITDASSMEQQAQPVENN